MPLSPERIAQLVDRIREGHSSYETAFYTAVAEAEAAASEDAARWRWIAPRLTQITPQFALVVGGQPVDLQLNAMLPSCTKAQADAAVDRLRKEEK